MHKNFIKTLLSVSQFGGISVLFLFLSAGTAFASSGQVPGKVIEHGLEQRFASTDSLAPQAANVPVTTSLSNNWSGYVADSASDYTSVTGTWVVPSVTASTSVAADATWVGIGGLSGTDLIQAGTQAMIQNGTTSYEAWYEMLPNGSTPIPLTVHPGDSVTASLSETSPNTWLIHITDNTTGASYSNTVNYTSSLSSAEWIQEMPSDESGSFIPLDNFGSVPFTAAYTVIDGISEDALQANARALTLVSGYGSRVLSYPSALGSDGASFTVTRSDSDSEVQPHVVQTSSWGFTRGPGTIQGFTPDPSAQILQQIQQMQSAVGINDPGMSALMQEMQSMQNELQSMESEGASSSYSIPLPAAGKTQTYSEGPYTVTVTTF